MKRKDILTRRVPPQAAAVCRVKVTYKTKHAAERAARSMLRRALRPYACNVCVYWHLTSDRG